MAEGVTEPSKEHRLVSSPGPRRYVWRHHGGVGLPDPPVSWAILQSLAHKPAPPPTSSTALKDCSQS